jgi:hypothetical protein
MSMPMNQDPSMMEEEEDQEGGRRHKGSKKAHKKTRKVNPALKSWVAFVKRVQHEEKISYPDAMKRASKRKSEWKRGGAPLAPAAYSGGSPLTPADVVEGYSRSGGGRRTKRRGGKKRRTYRRR